MSRSCDRAFKVLHWAGVYQPFRPAIFRAFRAILCLRNIEAFTAITVRARVPRCPVPPPSVPSVSHPIGHPPDRPKHQHELLP